MKKHYKQEHFPVPMAGCPFLLARAASGSPVPDVTAVAWGPRVFPWCGWV